MLHATNLCACLKYRAQVAVLHRGCGGLVVRTVDCGSANPGSTPGRGPFNQFQAHAERFRDPFVLPWFVDMRDFLHSRRQPEAFSVKR